MDRNAVVKVGAMASATVCALFGGVVFAQYMLTKKQRAGKKTKIIEMVSAHIFTLCHGFHTPSTLRASGASDQAVSRRRLTAVCH